MGEGTMRVHREGRSRRGGHGSRLVVAFVVELTVVIGDKGLAEHARHGVTQGARRHGSLARVLELDLRIGLSVM